MKVGMRQPYRGKATTHRCPVIVTVVFVYTHKFESYGKRESSKSMTQLVGNILDEGIVERVRTKLSGANFTCYIGQ